MARQPGDRELRSLVLGILVCREAYGYEVAAELRTIEGGLDLREGSVYPALRRLEHDGLAAGRWVEIGAGVPRRRYYSITPKGLAEAARRRPVRGAAPARRLPETLRP